MTSRDASYFAIVLCSFVAGFCVDLKLYYLVGLNAGFVVVNVLHVFGEQTKRAA